MSETSFTEKSDGSGTITFGESNSPWLMMRGFYWPGMPNTQAPALEMIPDVRKVYEIIQQAQQSKN